MFLGRAIAVHVPLDAKDVFYCDENHVSGAGAKLILNQLFKEAHKKWGITYTGSP